MSIPSPAQVFNSLVNFDGANTGANPDFVSLVQGTDGSLYGTTYNGGANGQGTVFKLTQTGTLTDLHAFNGTDGAQPGVGLVLAVNGNLYGTTQSGGANGVGTVFMLRPAGALTTLHSFDGIDGAGPAGPLVQTSGGTFFGMTFSGGFNGSCPFGPGCGTVFKMTPGGELTNLYSFAGYPTDGSDPNTALVQAADGNFYGTTEYSGMNSLGTIFKVTSGGDETVLYNFAGPDGANPIGTLTQGTDGNFYGTTPNGGSTGYGTVFRFTLGGELTTLYSFSGTDGGHPISTLVRATDGNFYGTTSLGGASGNGTIFRITPGGTLTTLHTFNYTDGTSSRGGLVQATNGVLYGTTYEGGTNGLGTIFSLSAGLNPFVKFIPAGGQVGTPVKILGSNLVGATNVSFNGIQAAFVVVSRYLITTSVPEGATSGEVKVTTPRGTLSSNANFHVR